MTRIYECMFLMDNDVVRAGWNEAKAYVSTIVEKHGGKVLSARRWDERRLSYPIRRKNRATFLLSYCELPAASIQELRREIDLSETIMRYLILSAEAVPESELELTREESGDEFEIPEVPDDDAIDEVATPEGLDDSSDDAVDIEVPAEASGLDAETIPVAAAASSTNKEEA